MKKTPNIVQAWATAARLRTLPIPTIQVLTGAALAYSITGTMNWSILLYTWLVAVFITIGTNLINDVIDFDKGENQPKRVGFLKVISAGIISRKNVQLAGLTSFALALFFGMFLGLHAGWVVFILIVLSVICGYCYTGGPYPISYLGLSELFILVFYGGVCVGAAFYLQTGYLSFAAMLCALQMGLLAILPNALNNFRDMHEDVENNKFTLAVRFGKTFARWELTILTFLPFALGIIWLFLGNVEAALIPLFLLPMAFLFVKELWAAEPGPLFNRFFALSVLLHFLFGIFLVIGFFLEY